MPEIERYPRPFPPAFADRWGDDQFGLWGEFRIETRHGGAEQRLRWIEPGTFLMGSPEDEPERFGDEGPQHAVTLTRGYWLADTACTQALWRAVTGGTPSRFAGDELPVEQVSWNDVQGFLRGLEALLLGSIADLPSEAEWEYACRAGTDTPFSFGATITPEQVNYHGPYAGGARGLYRGKTVPVRSLPANPWGLYEMHGNVREWCADGRRQYGTAPQTDPRGPEGKTSVRALRGGSWFGFAGRARSACRDANLPDVASVSLGFRLCLRSSRASPAEPV
jgi:formylglycine-generating enzyme required for sulfatase activity